SPKPRHRVRFDTRTRALATAPQDVELLLLDAGSPENLLDRVEQLSAYVGQVSYAELADVAATLHRQLRGLPWRAAVVAGSPEDAQHGLHQIGEALRAGANGLSTPDGRSLLGHVGRPGRIGYLFPGQGSGRGVSGGALRRRFPEAEEVYTQAALPAGED